MSPEGVGVDSDEGQLWFLQDPLWSCGTQSAQPSGTSTPTLVPLNTIWNGFKDQEDGSVGDVPTAETQGLLSDSQQPSGGGGTKYGRPHLLLQLQEAETGGSRGLGQFSAFPEVTVTTNQFQNLFLLKENVEAPLPYPALCKALFNSQPGLMLEKRSVFMFHAKGRQRKIRSILTMNARNGPNLQMVVYSYDGQVTCDGFSSIGDAEVLWKVPWEPSYRRLGV